MSQNFRGSLEDMGVNGPTLKQYLYDNWQAIVSQWAGENPPENPSPGQPWLDISQGWDKAVLKRWGGSSWAEVTKNTSTGNDVELAKGSKDTLWQRLEVSLNEDGTLKAGAAENMTEWIDSGLVPTYVSANEFSVPGDQTDIFIKNRKIKATFDSYNEYSSIKSNNYDSFNDITNVVVYKSIIDSTIQKIEYGLIKPGIEGSQPGNVNDLEQFNIDGFANYVKDIEPQGGVKRISYDDPAIEYSDNTFINGDYKGINSGGTISLKFTGIALAFITNYQIATLDVSIDGGIATSVTVNTSVIYTDNGLVELVSGLTDGEHTADITVTSGVLYVAGFDVIQNSKTKAGTSYIDSEKQEVLADTQSYNTPATGRADLLLVGKDGLVSVVEGVDGQSEKAFRVEEDGTISREYIEDIPEWLKDGVRVWNSGVTGNTATGWLKQNSSVYSNNYTLVSYTTDASFYIGFIGTGLDLYTVKGSNRGILAVSIDGEPEINHDMYQTSTETLAKVNVASGLPFGYHEIKLRVTGNKNVSSTSSIIYIDAFDIHLPATPTLPADTQALAKIYPMPSPATMASIPARPTSAEEKGWVRHESDEGCRYVGSGWTNTIGEMISNNKYYYTSAADDFVEKTFIGDGIRFISTLSGNGGIAEISIDGIVKTTVDLYKSGATEYKKVVYENTSLSMDAHTIKIRVTGNKNASAIGYNLWVDAFEVHRPLYLTDIRNLSPVKDKDLYEIDFHSRLKEPLASGKLGEVIDRLFKMDNVIKIENENGTAYLYPDGRAECFVLGSTTLVGSSYSYPEFYLPTILTKTYAVSITANVGASATYLDGTDWGTYTFYEDKIKITVRNSTPSDRLFGFSFSVKGRWY